MPTQIGTAQTEEGASQSQALDTLPTVSTSSLNENIDVSEPSSTTQQETSNSMTGNPYSSGIMTRKLNILVLGVASIYILTGIALNLGFEYLLEAIWISLVSWFLQKTRMLFFYHKALKEAKIKDLDTSTVDLRNLEAGRGAVAPLSGALSSTSLHPKDNPSDPTTVSRP